MKKIIRLMKPLETIIIYTREACVFTQPYR